MNFITNLWENNRMVFFLIVVLIIVTPFLIFYLSKAKKEHPKGLIAAALSNMGERFGYYIMNAVLLLFLVSKFGLPDGTAGVIYSVFYFGIYVLSLVGGIIADKTQNYKKTIICGLVVMAIGYIILSIPVFGMGASGSMTFALVLTMLALILIACGNGLFKGNLQAIVGQLYDDFEAEAAKKGPELLGYGQLLLGIIDCFVVSYGILFWFLGFGLWHIIFGIFFTLKNRRTAGGNNAVNQIDAQANNQ